MRTGFNVRLMVRGLLLSAAGVMATAGVAVGSDEEHTFRLDNGMIEIEYTRASRVAAFGNYFYTPEDATVEIHTVTATVGYGQDGREFEVLVYNDPDNDGNPSNAVLVARQTSVIQAGRTSEAWRTAFLQTVTIPNAEVSGGFFVVVHLFDQPFNGGSINGSWSTAPSAYLLHGVPTGRSWAISGFPGQMTPLTPIDFDNLGNNFLTRSGGPGFVGNWIIRAEGTAGTGIIDPDGPRECLSDYNGDGGIDGADFEAFLIDWEAGESAADINQDGGVDGADVEIFFLAWSEGRC
jgi:hypothetical protein